MMYRNLPALFSALLLMISVSVQAQNDNLAQNATASASTQDLAASNAIDGDPNTRWASAAQTDPSHITIDLGQQYALSSVVIDWEAANADTYQILGSNDGSQWTTLATETGGTFGDRTDTINVAGDFRYVRMNGISRSAGNEWGYSIWELEIYGQGGGTGSAQTLQAEDYINAYDTTAGNTGGAYRSGDVDIEASTDDGGGYNVGWIEAGEWLEYTINLDADTYTVSSRVASDIGGGQFTIDLNGSEIVGTQNVDNTGGWQSWTTLTSWPIALPAGQHTVRVKVQSGDFNLNWLRFEPGSGGTDPDPQPVWSDEFDTIDSNNWTFETGGWGWGNQELQYYTGGDNAFIQYDPDVDSNVLVLEARQENPQGYDCWYGYCSYTSTRMISKGKQEFQYGRMEARIKLPQTQGIWPAFWMMGNDFDQVGWPNNGEIDIMEHVGFEPNLTHGALHGPGYSGDTPINGTHDLGESADANYHVYAVEWDENGIDWYVDDVNFYSVSRTQVEQYGNWVYDHPFFFLLNIAVGGSWPGEPDGTSQFPQRMYVDYVRVYQ